MSAGSTSSAASRVDAGLWTIPNAFTLVRLLCLPVFVWLLAVDDRRVAAALVLGALGATDWIDGFLARRLDQQSEFGAKFDPTVDRLLLIIAVVTILLVDAMPVWFGLAVLAREVLVGGAVAVATVFFRMKRFDVTFIGKTATLMLMFAIPAFLLGSSTVNGAGAFDLIGWILGLPGIVLSYATGVAYIPRIAAGIGAGRAELAAHHESA